MLKQLAIVLALVACNKHKEAPPATTGSGSAETGSGSAVAAAPADAAAPTPAPYTPAADTSEPIKAAIAAEDRSPDAEAQWISRADSKKPSTEKSRGCKGQGAAKHHACQHHAESLTEKKLNAKNGTCNTCIGQ